VTEFTFNCTLDQIGNRVLVVEVTVVLYQGETVTEALLVIGVVLSALAVALCVLIIFRSGRTASGIPAILDLRLLSIEGVIGRSDAIIRDELGRGREETRDGARSLREESPACSNGWLARYGHR